MVLKDSTILVTGADGFIGSHLVELLVTKGSRVKALSYYNSFNNWGWLESIPSLSSIEVMTGDVRDPHYCMKILGGVDIVFHLAALIAIPYSYVSPDSYADTNIKGTLNICQAALQNDCNRVIHTSTSEVYGTARYVPIDEDHPLQPQSPYSASKVGADALANSFYASFALPLTIARPFNTYGPRQSARAIIPTIITQIASGKKGIELGNLTPTRDFTYVEDTCSGLIALAECKETIGETVNIGSNREISIESLLNLVKDIMGSDVEVHTNEHRLRPEKSEVYRLWCDNTKIRELTGFVPKYTIRDGLEKTVSWFTNPENLRNYKADIYNT
jgi:NAD dependent epimerase/dehydratase